MADHSGAKKRFLAVFAAIGVTFTALLFTIGTGDWLKASAFFIVAYVGFAGSIVFYEAFLPHISVGKDIDRVSSRGYALGYLGGGMLLTLNLVWILKPKTFLMADAEAASRFSFLSVALWWAVFSIPLLRRVPEPARGIAIEQVNPVRAGVRRLARTFRDIRRYKELTKFLIAFWLYSDGIGTVIKMATIYGSEIGIGRSALIGALLVVQFIGIPCTILFGALAGRVGAKTAIYLALGIYCFVALGGYFMSEAWHFWLLAFLVAVAQGGAQALSRSVFGRMVPKSKSAEFFGFFSVSSRFAGIFGPLLFAVIGQITGTSRLSIVALLIFFIAGGALLTRVDIDEGMSVALAESDAVSS
jgi:UMF1 family MFS transporter